MHLKYVILDGFKSYRTKTVVGKYDPHFNAITGLNGSGKSNILDGIIFVLGLSSLQTVRAQSMADLINKGGNVKRCSVSLVFDNRDKNRSPIGYENCPEIVVSRSVEEGNVCKYHLNGVTSSKKAITDLFHSIQLNINNPNFMIMQGKITKVVNMKPKEIVCMLEECVGATTYKLKRDKAIYDVREKDHQMEQINDALQNVIFPSARQQESALKIYHEFKSLDSQRHKLAQEYAVAAYGHYMEVLAKKSQRSKELRSVEKDEDDKVEKYNQQIEDKQKRRAEILKESEKISTEKHSVVDKQFKEVNKKVAAYEVAHETALSGVQSAQAKLTKAQKDLTVKEKQVAEFGNKSGVLVKEFTALKDEIEEAKVKLAESQKKESEVSAGKVVGEDGQTFDLRERLVVVEDEFDKISPKHEHEGRLLKTDEKHLRDLEARLSKTPSDKQIETEFKNAQTEVDRLHNQLLRLKISPEQFESSDKDYNAAAQRLNILERERNRLLQENQNLAFSYTPPTPNFNPNSVRGCLFELFTTPDLGMYRDAFEVAAGGSLYVIVVDTDATARAIIKNGNVAVRRTYMPLSKVRKYGRPLSQKDLDNKVGPGRAVCALSLMKYDREYEDLMTSYFGNTILCDTMETAKIVAYQMKYRAITVKGDVCDPDGGMQGGTRKNLGRLITACQTLGPANVERNEILAKLRDLKTQMDHYNRNGPLLKSYDLAIRRLKEVGENRQCTTFATLQGEINVLKEGIKARKEKMDEWSKELAKWGKERTELRRILDSFDEEMEKNLKLARAEIAKWTKALQNAQKKYDSKKATFDTMETDLQSREALLDEFRKDIEKAEKELEEAKADAAAKKEAYDGVKLSLTEKEKELDEVVEERRVWDEEAEKLEGEIGGIKKKIHKIELAKINRDNDLKNTEEQLDATQAYMNELNKLHPELKLTTKYDELDKPTKKWTDCKDALDKATKRCEELRKRVDPEAGEKMRETKSMEEDANYRLETLKENKKTLEKTIERLNKQMRALVRGAFEIVNKELGAMMTTLLPESTAKLHPVADERHLDEGVSIHVQLGGVWKESLTELSGGQRSLVALALVLSLCKFQPAPFYIMDEIDAALDLSHTQNIGVLIKQRFHDTQFICVSLKDGMYTNANALFTTNFENGESKVKRYPPNPEGEEDDESSRKGKQKRGK